MTRRFLPALAAVAALVPAARTDSKKTAAANGNGDDPPASAVNIGAPLFDRAEYKPVQAARGAADPITVPMANVVIKQKVDLPSEVDGVVRWVGVEIDEAAAARLQPGDVFEHPRDKKKYRRLVPGDIVRRGQVVAMLDDDVAFMEWKSAATKADVARRSAEAYAETVVQLDKIVIQQRQGVQKGIVPEQELYSSLATLARYKAEKVDHEGSAGGGRGRRPGAGGPGQADLARPGRR
jgi:hypothetical protein